MRLGVSYGDARRLLMASALRNRSLRVSRLGLDPGRSLSTAMSMVDPQPSFPEQNTSCSKKRPIYVAATRQDVGKTSVSLALTSGLQKRFGGKVGFLKPVGQKCLEVEDEFDGNRKLLVDKDVVVVRQHFGLDHIPFPLMSPVVIPPGYTKDYLDGKISNINQDATIQTAFRKIDASNDVVLCEGTGHCAVGSIVGASNAQVASMLGASMVLVANGGLGKAFDELELNRVLCKAYGVHIAGVVINKVQTDKYDQTKHYIEKALRHHWGDVPLLGCIPDRPYLGCPALSDLEKLFGTQLWSGRSHRLRHYTVKDLNLVATSLSVFLENLRIKPSRTLYVCHVSRDDIILGFLAEYQRRMHVSNVANEPPFEAALVVCGKPNKFQLNSQVLDMIGCNDPEGRGPPILAAPYTSREVMEMVHLHTPKLNVDDTHRVETTVRHYEPYIDFDLLLERTGNARRTDGRVQAHMG